MGGEIELILRLAQTNRISFVMIENERRRSRGSTKTFVCQKEITGATDPQTLRINITDFKDVTDGSPLRSRQELDQFGCVETRFHLVNGHVPLNEIPAWQGPQAEFLRLKWM